ncbi:hypothetical protein HZA42_00250 [Candidatus Peregrinibacteria bacterium]|nr:hypothetical protein [Candidatus Peregrinibacteria bacterium]
MQITDEKLYDLCKRYGFQTKLWRQKFIGLLPEVNRRCLYEKKGFFSVFEFAAKLCGLSREQVCLALNLEKRFEDKPTLKSMLENGEASINKLARVVSIATPENEEELAARIKVLPIAALNTLVRDEKYAQNKNASGQISGVGLKDKNGLPKPLSVTEGLYVHDFELADDVTAELGELHSRGIDVNALLRKMLRKRREEIEEEVRKNEPASKKTGGDIGPTRTGAKAIASRYIPVAIKKILHEEYGTKCSIQTCKKPAQIIHHTQRFGLSQNHDPRFLAPLCKEHHAIAHSIDLSYNAHAFGAVSSVG